MSHKPSHRGTSEPRSYAPELKALESRTLLSGSQTLSFPDGQSFLFSPFKILPRTGGVFVQQGSVLSIGVGQRTSNAVVVNETGAGGDTVEWNGRPAHSLTGIQATEIELARASRNQVTIQLTSQRTGPAAIAKGAVISTEPALPSPGDRPFIKAPRTSGVAVQAGTVLTITVDRPASNTVEISNNGGGAVATTWNGGSLHSFTGVDTIVVKTQHPGKDVVAID